MVVLCGTVCGWGLFQHHHLRNAYDVLLDSSSSRAPCAAHQVHAVTWHLAALTLWLHFCLQIMLTTLAEVRMMPGTGALVSAMATAASMQPVSG